MMIKKILTTFWYVTDFPTNIRVHGVTPRTGTPVRVPTVVFVFR